MEPTDVLSTAPVIALPAGPAADASTAASIGQITIRRLDIFDPNVPGENLRLFKIANKIHIVTRDEVVRREILFKPGEPWDARKSLESERNLRAIGFFRRVEIKPVPAPGNKLDLEVLTQDSWTTMAQFSVGTEGGDHFLIYGITERNLLGRNKTISLIHWQNGPFIRNNFFYHDPRLWATRYKLSTFYSTTFRGDSIGLDVTRPFFSLETPYALGGGWARLINETILFKDALENSKFISDTRLIQASAGRRLEADGLFVQRVQAGWYLQRDRFTPTMDTLGSLPAARELSGPTLGYSWVQPKYIKESYINRMERVEDFNMGNELRVLAGYMGKALGSNRDRMIFNAVAQQGLRFAPGRFILAQIGATGRTLQGKNENVLLFSNLNLFWKTEWPLPQTWVGHVEYTSGLSLDKENQVMLGGNNGLRGYKNYSFAGAKSLLVNFENRWFLPGEYFHLMRFGGAVFFDSGSVVPQGSGTSWIRFRSDVGVGLRVASTRSTGGHVMRFDIAYALNQGPGGSRVVFSARGGQAFDFFSSSSRRVKQSPASRLETNRGGDSILF